MDIETIRQVVESGATPTITCEAAKILLDEIDRLIEQMSAEFERGVVEGSTTQAMLEIQGRERFLESIRKH